VHVEQSDLGFGHPSQRVAVDAQHLHQGIIRNARIERRLQGPQRVEVAIGPRPHQIGQASQVRQTPYDVRIDAHSPSGLLEGVSRLVAATSSMVGSSSTVS
jgi:hypothetical protein